ncbi:hypothetical protein AYO45_00955 [Gammaproteobacteria bacterium SCGC AG-212-F23]|nr:hypothetical protein AYO45_00955 [Gammaproteobacteria bacterium SCGC AG-212-F23]
MKSTEELTKEVYTQADRYFNEFVSTLNQDKIFVKNLDNLVEAEARSNNFDHVGQLLKLQPSPQLSGVFDYINNYKIWKEKSDIESLRTNVVVTLQNNIQKFRVINNKNIKLEDNIAFEIFVNRVTSNYLWGAHQHALDYTKKEAELRTKLSSANNIDLGLKVLREHSERHSKFLSHLKNNNDLLLKGQTTCHELLDKIQKTSNGQKISIDQIDKRLKKFNITINGKLKQVLENDSETQIKLTKVCDYLEIQKKREDKKLIQEQKMQDAKGMMDLCGFAAELGRMTGNKDVVKLGAIACAAVQISTNISLLSTMTVFSMSAFTPMVGIPMAIFSCVSLFMDDDSGDEQAERDKAFLEILINIAKGIHEHLDFIHDDLSKKIISGFADNQENQSNIVDILRKIDKTTSENQIENRQKLDTILNKLVSIANKQRNDIRSRRLGEISEYIALTTGPHTLPTSEFISLFNKFQNDICNRHGNDAALIGDVNPIESTLKDYEDDHENPLCVDFNIRSFKSYITEQFREMKLEGMVNPAVFAWQIMAFSKLITDKYQKDTKALNKISKSEVQILESILEKSKGIQQLSNNLHNKTIITKLIENHLNFGRIFLEEVKKYVKKAEADKNKELYDEFIKGDNSVDIFDKKLIAEFESQGVNFDLVANSTWWSGHVSNNHPNFWVTHGNSEVVQSYFTAATAGVHVDSHRKTYLTDRKKSVDNFVHDYLQGPKEQLEKAKLGNNRLLNANFQFYDSINLQNHYFYAFAAPNESTKTDGYTLILPLPKNYQFKVLKSIQTAQWLQIGKVQFEYSIKKDDKSIAKDNNNTKKDNNKYTFSIQANFVKNNQKEGISILSLPFEFNMYKGNEALWWWWVGGSFSVGNNYSWVTVEQHKQDAWNENVWMTKAYIPSCSNIPGIREKMSDLKAAKGEEKNLLNNESGILQDIKLKRDELLTQFYEILSKEVSSNEQSALSKSLIHYSHSFYIIKYALILAYGEDNCRLIPELNYFFDPINKDQFIRHRLELLLFIKFNSKINISVIEVIEKTLAHINDKLIISIDKLFTITPSILKRSIFDNVVNEFQNLINWYNKNYVDENQLVNKVSMEKQLEEQNKLQTTVLKALQSVIMSNLSEAQQRMVFFGVQNQLNKEGISLSSSLPLLLMPPSSDKPASIGSFSIFSIKNNLTNDVHRLATSEQIQATLESKLNNLAHIISPEMGSTDNIFSPDERVAKRAAIDLVLQINGYEAKDSKSATGFIQKDGGSLRKPIIGILNTSGVSESARKSNNTSAIGGSHWVALVILPASTTSAEKIYLLDSLNPNRQLPNAFKNVLLTQTQYTFSAPKSETDPTATERTHLISAPFPNAVIVDSPLPRILQKDGWSCGIWAVHLGLELIKHRTLNNEDSLSPNFDDYPLLCRASAELRIG